MRRDGTTVVVREQGVSSVWLSESQPSPDIFPIPHGTGDIFIDILPSMVGSSAINAAECARGTVDNILFIDTNHTENLFLRATADHGYSLRYCSTSPSESNFRSAGTSISMGISFHIGPKAVSPKYLRSKPLTR